MVELRVLSGKLPGTTLPRAGLPFTIGRGKECDVKVDENGVWDKHASFSLTQDGFIHAAAQGQAYLLVNGNAVSDSILRNGDILELGGLKLKFGLAAPLQHSLRVREFCTWGIILLVALAEAGLLFWSSGL